MKHRYVAAATALAGAGAACVLLARPWHLRWGATEQESRAPLPGDDLLANPDLAATRAIIVRASTAEVWPWIAQLGQGRYAYTKWWTPLLVEPVEAISFVMSQKMTGRG
jgi:hypothetical protein